MKPTTKILSVSIAVQIAFSCFALAVESTKTITPLASKTAMTATKAVGKTTNKKKLLAKKKTASKSTKASLAKKAEVTNSNATNSGKAAKAANAITETAITAPMEQKEAIETEIDTIDQMEALVAADAKSSPTVTSNATVAAPAETSWIKPSISLAATYNMAAEAPKEGDQNRYMEYEFIPSLVTGPIKTLVWFKYGQSLIDNSQSEWQDLPIIFSMAKPYNAGDYITLSPAIAFTIPQTRATKDNVQLNYATNANVIIGLNTKTLGWDGVVLNLQTGYTKMTNEFTTSAKGEPIVSYRLRQRINFWYPIVENLYFKSRVEFNSTFSYENVVKNDFMHFVALEYGFLEKYSVNIGTTNGGPTMTEPNYENNLKFYNDTSSEYFLGVGADF